MRESLSKALYASDLEWDIPERPIDRIAALRASSALGSALFRWKIGQDGSSRGLAYVLALRLASKRLRIAPHHKDFPTLKRAVKQALTEWHSPMCRACAGVKIIHVDRQAGLSGVDHVCPTCSGAGVHRYSDWERAVRLQVKRLGEWSSRIEAIVHMLNAKEIAVVAGVRRELERN